MGLTFGRGHFPSQEMGLTFGRGHFPSQEMGPTFGRGHFPSQEMGPTFGRGHFPSQEMSPTFGRGHFPSQEMGPTFGRGHFPSLGRPTPFYFLLLLTTYHSPYYLSLPLTYLYMYTQRSALRWKGILSILCLTATPSASAQRTYTLDECLRLGAENNLTLRNS